MSSAGEVIPIPPLVLESRRRHGWIRFEIPVRTHPRRGPGSSGIECDFVPPEDMRGALGLDDLPSDDLAMLTGTVDKCLNPADPSVV